MGGYGSTRWSGHCKASTVEESKPLPISATLRYGGFISWRVREREAGSASYTIHRDNAWNPTGVTMRYTITPPAGKPQQYEYPIKIVTRRTASGIVQLLWRCPLTTMDRPCGRLVRTLYLPPDGAYFGCRHCHRLVYSSAQTHDKRMDYVRALMRGDLRAARRFEPEYERQMAKLAAPVRQ